MKLRNLAIFVAAFGLAMAANAATGDQPAADQNAMPAATTTTTTTTDTTAAQPADQKAATATTTTTETKAVEKKCKKVRVRHHRCHKKMKKCHAVKKCEECGDQQ